jgi:tRNA A37 methylthiotransferase MiaB
MRRGYSQEVYMDLLKLIRRVIPDVSLSTDIIAGFCGETEAHHAETVRLMREIQFDQAFMYKYSQREKVHIHTGTPCAPNHTRIHISFHVSLRRMRTANTPMT